MENDVKSDAPFALRVFGDLSLTDSAGRMVGEARRKPLAVLAYLAATAPAPVNRDALATLLWPDLDVAKAKRSLNQAIYALRTELAMPELIVGASQITVSSRHIVSDLQRYRDHVEAGELELALAAYAGPFLDVTAYRGCAEFERWVERERTRWAESHRSTIVLQAAKFVLADEPARAVALLERGVAEYPSDVRLVTALCEQLLAAGEQREALVRINRFEATGRAEFGVALPESLELLRARVLAGGHVLGGADARVHAATGASSHASSHASSRASIDVNDVAHASDRNADDAPFRVRQVSRTRHRMLRIVGGAAALVLAAAMGAVGATQFSQPRLRPVPDSALTLWEASENLRSERRQSYLKEVDSTKIGRAMVLSVNVRPDTIQSRFARLFEDIENMQLRYMRDGALTGIVPLKRRLELEQASAACRCSTSSEMEIAKMMDSSGAAVVVEPALYLQGDSLLFSLTAHRSLRGTHHERRGSANLESERFFRLAVVGDRPASAVMNATLALNHYLASLETCTPARHAEIGTSSWCWQSRNHLGIVPGVLQQRELRAERRLLVGLMP